MTPEGLVELFRQLAFISALIGGFAFAFLGTLLTASSRSRVVEWAAGTAMATAADLTVCVVGWTLMASQLASTTPAGAGVFRFPASLNTIHSRLSLLLLVGLLLFLVSLGLSGWVRSRLLGIISTVIAMLAGVALMFVVPPFLQ